MKKIELSDHFTCTKLLLYSLPAIGEMIAISSFEFVDGLFLTNYLGVTAFVAIDLIIPPFLILFALGYMFGAGANALVSQYQGKGDTKTAREIFSLSTAAMMIVGILVALIGIWQMPNLSMMVGAEGEKAVISNTYGMILMAGLPAFIINAAFQSLWITAEKAVLGLIFSILNGVLNVALDWLFMGPFHMGTAGAALATVLSAVIPAVITLLYFLLPNPSTLRFVRFPLKRLRELPGICFNGASEMISELAVNLTMLIAYKQVLRTIGDAGVAAMGAYNTIIEVFIGVFYGVSTTVVTISGYKYGKKTDDELTSLVRTNNILMAVCGSLMFLTLVVFSRPLALAFFNDDPAVCDLTVHVLRIMAFSCFFYGFEFVTGSTFTGMGDGLSSMIIAAFGSFIAPVAMIFAMPALFGAEGLYWAMPVALFLTAVLCVIFLKKRYPVLLKNTDRDDALEE